MTHPSAPIREVAWRLLFQQNKTGTLWRTQGTRHESLGHSGNIARCEGRPNDHDPRTAYHSGIDRAGLGYVPALSGRQSLNVGRYAHGTVPDRRCSAVKKRWTMDDHYRPGWRFRMDDESCPHG